MSLNSNGIHLFIAMTLKTLKKWPAILGLTECSYHLSNFGDLD